MQVLERRPGIDRGSAMRGLAESCWPGRPGLEVASAGLEEAFLALTAEEPAR